MTRPVGIEIFYWLDNWSDDQSSVFSKAAEAGYEGVEISLVAGLDVGVDRMARTAASLGLDVLCSTGLNPEDGHIESRCQGSRRGDGAPSALSG